MLGLGDRAGGWKRGGVEGGGGRKIIENYVMDGQKDYDVISTAYRCLLLWMISIVSGAFGQTRRKGGGSGDGGFGFFMNKRGQGRRRGGEGGGAGHFNMCAETINPQRGQT